MKHPKKIYYLCFCTVAAFLTLWACLQESDIISEPDIYGVLTIARAQELFEKLAPELTVVGLSQVAGDIDVAPMWKHARSFNINTTQVVEAPLNIVPDYSFRPGDSISVIQRVPVNTLMYLVARQEDGQKKVSYHVMVIVADNDYLKSGLQKLFKLSLSSLSDFSGRILNYDIKGKLRDGEVYNSGKLSGVIHPLSYYQSSGGARAETQGNWDCERFWVERTGEITRYNDPIELDELVVTANRFYPVTCLYFYNPIDLGGSGGGGGGGGGGYGGSGSGGGNNPPPQTNPPPTVAPKAKKIFRNSNMSDIYWNKIESMLDKIISNCMGNALYDGLVSSLGGKTIIIGINSGENGSFTITNEAISISIGQQMESNQLCHEMMHVYQAYQEVISTYSNSKLNIEIEAHYAQYLYLSSLPVYKGSKWETKWEKTDPRRKETKSLEKFIDAKGNLKPGANYADLDIAILNKVKPTFEMNGYPSNKYPFNYDRSGSENFKNIRKLTKNC